MLYIQLNLLTEINISLTAKGIAYGFCFSRQSPQISKYFAFILI